MTHITRFISAVEQKYNTRFRRAYGRPKANVRQTAYYVIWKFSGYRQSYIGSLVGVTVTGVWSGIHRQRGYIESGEMGLYNEILQLYIDCCREQIGVKGRSM